MKQLDLIHKLKGLRELKPSNEFAAVSKLIILNDGEGVLNTEVAKKLSHLKRLAPTAHFAAVSRELILGREINKRATLGTVLRKSFTYSLAVGVMVIFMAVITSVGYLGFLSPIPTDIYVKNVSDATNAIKDIDIHLKEAEYFAAADSKASLALREASTTTLIEHANPILIEHESQQTNFKDPRDKNIDSLLNQATL